LHETKASYGGEYDRTILNTNTLSPTSNRLNATAGPVPSKTNTYDGAGNLTGDATINYTYGTNGRMETASTAGVTTRYRYNGRGERVLKTSSVDSRHYVYDEQGHLLGEYDASGTPLQETVYLGDLPVVVMKPGASGPTVYNVYADYLQAPRVITRASDNQIVWRWDHTDPFGLVQPDENPGGLGTFTYNLRFPGQVFDKETNNHYNYFRDYDSQTGRYIQSDLIGLEGGINTYSYVEGNPLSKTDELGLVSSYGIPDVYNTNRYAPTSPDPCGCAAKAMGLETAAGVGLGGGGQPSIPKNFSPKGASAGTSPISKGLSKALPQKLPMAVPAPTTAKPFATSNVLGRVLGRWAPFIGWGIIANDVSQYAACIKECIKNENCTVK
jgi:RHS repeat-associated protein